MAPRKGWEYLSSTYRQRLERGGVTEDQYRLGGAIHGARGHGSTPEHRSFLGLGRRFGLDRILEGYGDMDRADQEYAAQLYVQGFMSKGRGKVLNPHRKKGDPVRRGASKAQVIARMDFMDIMDEYGESMTKEDWKFFKSSYNETFAAA
jgi:hypothetical protein